VRMSSSPVWRVAAWHTYLVKIVWRLDPIPTSYDMVKSFFWASSARHSTTAAASMAVSLPMVRPLGCLKAMTPSLVPPQICWRRHLSTIYSQKPERVPLPANLPKEFYSQLPERLRPDNGRYLLSPSGIYLLRFALQVIADLYYIEPRKIDVIPPPPSACSVCKDPVATVTASQLAILDPTGERKALFDYRRNPRSVKAGDILRVTFKSGDPFSGVCLGIRLRGIDTSFLLRNQLTRVGVEMWIKVFSPNVESVEIVQRTEKRKRRARLYYMRFVLLVKSDRIFSWLPADTF
jgi:large subunit ribosomal protein L19